MAHPLAVYLDSKGLSQHAFAARAGIQQPYISRVINGHTKRFSAPVAERISKLTGIPFKELMLPGDYGPVGPKRRRRAGARGAA